jgi:sugar/nucleoside kinase (ribokinase family)
VLHEVAGHVVDVVDTTGAGDVFRGAFIYALLRGDDPADVLRFANAAAAVSCTRLGAIASVPTLLEIRDRLEILDP